MQRTQTKAVILKRIDYEEADRIVTMLTPEHGQITGLAKGVRKQKSKLAGGIELFSISDITLLQGKGSMQRIISTRLDEHFSNIISDYNRMELGYRLIDKVLKATADLAEEGVYDILVEAFHGLNDLKVSPDLVEIRFYLSMLDTHGQMPNLKTDAKNQKLDSEKHYFLDISSGVLQESERGDIAEEQIKLLRLLSANPAAKVAKISGTDKALNGLAQNMRELFEFVF